MKFSLVKNYIPLFLLLSGLTLAVASCEKDDDNGVDNERELITTVRLALTGSALPGGAVSFIWSDTDGSGGKAPSIDSIKLPQQTTLNYTIEVLDESSIPGENLTSQIEAEGADHIFLFSSTPDGFINFAPQDVDSDGNPIGLTGQVTTGPGGSGTLSITLKHNADKDNPAATGETDIEVEFPAMLD